MPTKDPGAQLIAKAIAAFSDNNRCRRQIGQQIIPAKVFAGITLSGTVPIFYKIPVTDALLYSITTAQFPPQPTVVQRLVPPVQNIAKLFVDGMWPLENRHIILQCFEAFKQFI